MNISLWAICTVLHSQGEFSWHKNNSYQMVKTHIFFTDILKTLADKDLAHGENMKPYRIDLLISISHSLKAFEYNHY
jgi:hypothetical protein